MYVRPQSYRYPSGVRLPENYSGNTFRELPVEEEAPSEEAAAPEPQDTAEQVVDSSPEQKSDNTQSAALLSNHGFRLRLGSLFGNSNGGIGTEELLIIALILLLSDSNSNDDLILFLVLLLFIK